MFEKYVPGHRMPLTWLYLARLAVGGLLGGIFIAGSFGQPPQESATRNPAGESVQQPGTSPTLLPEIDRIPNWVADAVFYQIFPERFRNGDADNDPTRESLEHPQRVPETWKVTRWTADWYARSAWERELGSDFYQHGVLDRRYGGDLQGIIDKLDYLRELGINAVYLNPVFYARSLHKYDGICYHHVDPYFGPDPIGDLALMAGETADPSTWKWTEADKLFLEVIRQAHDRGIRIVMDGVFNHTGRDFFAFRDIIEQQEASSYTHWYVVHSFDDPSTPEDEFKYQCWWGHKSLPEFATNEDGTDLHAEPKQYVMDATRRWMDPNGDGDPQDGVDGWRLDVANELPDPFWQEWNQFVRGINRDVYTVAENWEDAAAYLQRCGFSATMNYFGFAYPTKGYLVDGGAAPTEFAQMLSNRRNDYSQMGQRALLNLIDSHDTDRVASMIVNARPDSYVQPGRFDYDVGQRVSPRHDRKYSVAMPNDEHREIQRLVALFQFTYVGAPMIYYGTEAGMWGADDPDDRKPMIWDDMTFDDESTGPLERAREPNSVKFDQELFRFYQSLIALRHKHPALRRGTYDTLTADDAQHSLMFKRQFEKDVLIVALNRSRNGVSLQVPQSVEGLPSRWELAWASNPGQVRLKTRGRNVTISLGPCSGVVIVATAE